VFAMLNEWPTIIERHEGSFIAPQENLVVGVSETQTCLVGGRTCPAHLSGNQLGDRICLVRDLVAE
jgi:hypothetical protein